MWLWPACRPVRPGDARQ